MTLRRRFCTIVSLTIPTAWAFGCHHSTTLTTSPVVLSQTPTAIAPSRPVAARGPVTDFTFYLPAGYRCDLNEWTIYTIEGRPIVLSVTAVTTRGETDHFGGPGRAKAPDSQAKACDERRASVNVPRDSLRMYQRFEFSASDSVRISGIRFASGQPRALVP